MKAPSSRVCKAQRCRGGALLLVVIIVAAAVIISATFLHGQSTSLAVSQNISHHTRARAIAESGLAAMIHEIRSNEHWRDTYQQGLIVSDQPMTGGSFSAWMEDGIDKDDDGIVDGDGDLADNIFDPLTLTVVGRFKGASSTAVVQMYPNYLESRIASTGKIELKGDAVVDSFYSTRGAYGGLNVGTNARLTTTSIKKKSFKLLGNSALKGDALVGEGGDPTAIIIQNASAYISGSKSALDDKVPIPWVGEPANMPNNVGYLGYSSGRKTLTGQIHAEKLDISNTAVVEISGVVTMLIENQFEMKGSSQLVILPNSRLDLYVKKSVKFKDNAQANVATANPGAFQIYHLGASEIKIERDAQVYANILAPIAKIKVKDRADLYGNVAAREVKVEHSGAIHQDLSTGYDPRNALYEADLVVADRLEFSQNAVVDSFDSRQGPYGGSNVGSDAIVATNSTIASKLRLSGNAKVRGDAAGGPGGDPNKVIAIQNTAELTGQRRMLSTPINIPVSEAPEDVMLLTPSTGAVQYISGTQVITGDINGHFHCDSFEVSGTAIVQIQGHVTIYCEGDANWRDSAVLEVLPDSSVEFFIGGKLLAKDTAAINTAVADPTVCTFYICGNKDVDLQNDSQLAAYIYAADSVLTTDAGTVMYGNFYARQAFIKGIIHVDSAPRLRSGGNPNSDKYLLRWIEAP